LRRFSVFFILVAVLAASLSPGRALGDKAVISDLLLTNTPEHLLVYFRLKGCFTKKMEEAILAGIPTTFTSYVELKRVRGFWFDKDIASVEVKHTIKYDAVKKLFFVTFQKDGNEEEAHQLTSFSEARDTMSDVNGIVLAPLGAMERGARYYVRVKSRMDRFRLPLHMEYVFFFVSLWDFETPWLREDFTY